MRRCGFAALSARRQHLTAAHDSARSVVSEQQDGCEAEYHADDVHKRQEDNLIGGAAPRADCRGPIHGLHGSQHRVDSPLTPSATMLGDEDDAARACGHCDRPGRVQRTALPCVSSSYSSSRTLNALRTGRETSMAAAAVGPRNRLLTPTALLARPGEASTRYASSEESAAVSAQR